MLSELKNFKNTDSHWLFFNETIRKITTSLEILIKQNTIWLSFSLAANVFLLCYSSLLLSSCLANPWRLAWLMFVKFKTYQLAFFRIFSFPLQFEDDRISSVISLWLSWGAFHLKFVFLRTWQFCLRHISFFAFCHSSEGFRMDKEG